MHSARLIASKIRAGNDGDVNGIAVIPSPDLTLLEQSGEASVSLRLGRWFLVLRQAKIPVFQSLPKDKLGAQVSVAEKMKIPWHLIMGKKEAIEHSIIVRDMETRSQETVPLNTLADYLKKLAK